MCTGHKFVHERLRKKGQNWNSNEIQWFQSIGYDQNILKSMYFYVLISDCNMVMSEDTGNIAATAVSGTTACTIALTAGRVSESIFTRACIHYCF